MVTRYLDFNRGSDSNDGSTPALAWKNLTKIDDAAYTAGDALLLADDSEWEYDLASRVIVPATWTGTQGNPVRIGKFSPLSANTGRPIIRWNRTLVAGDWTYDAPNNCWTYTAPYNVGAYCLVRINETWSASRTDAGLPLPSTDGRYHASNATFYMYAPAGTNPTDYYGEIVLSLTDVGFMAVSSGRGWVQFDDLQFEDTGTGIAGFSSTAADVGIIVNNVYGRRVSGLVTAVTTGTLGQLYATIRGVDIEDWGSVALWAYTANGEGIKALDISGCNIRDGMNNYSQGAIYCQTRGTGLRAQIHDNVFSGVKFGTRDKTQDGCAIYCETGSSGVDVYRNVVRDSYMAFQDNSGRANRWFSNVAIGCKTGMRISDQNANGAMNCEVSGNTFIVGADIAQEFGVGDTGTGVRVFCETTGVIASITIKNNVIFNTGPTATAAILTANENPVAADYGNNAVNGYTYTARREYLASTDSSPNTITADPLLSDSYRPLAGSPLLGAGAHIRYTRDADGKQRPNPPAIGAYDVATLRRLLTSDPATW